MASQKKSQLRQILSRYKKVYGSVFGFSAIVNFLMLAPSWYMLQVYDRVLTSHDITTLVGLSFIVVFLYLIYALLERYRGLVLVQVSEALDAKIAPLLHSEILKPLTKNKEADQNALNDLNTVKNFFTGQPILALLDTPWMLFYLATLFLLHSSLGWLAVISSLFLFSIALLSQQSTGKELKASQEVMQQERQIVSNSLNASESIRVMGMSRPILEKLQSQHQLYLQHFWLASTRGVNWSSLSKFFRTLIQSAVLGLGAYLSLQNEMSAGMMIAGSILLGRSLAPIEGLINSWKQIAEFKKSFASLEQVLEESKISSYSMELAPPEGQLELKNITVQLRTIGKATLQNISLHIPAGMSVAIIGPSGAGKSTLLKTLAGITMPQQGQALLDGFDLAHRDLDHLGQYIGYLGQSTDLMAGKISENIARLGHIDHQKVLKAAQLSGAHGVALSLPEGYETLLNDFGQGLSEGQKRKIALARALYNDPQIVFLDEPGTGLDDASLVTVIKALEYLKTNAKTVVFTTHQPRLAQLADRVILVMEGQIKMYGPSQEILKQLQGP